MPGSGNWFCKNLWLVSVLGLLTAILAFSLNREHSVAQQPAAPAAGAPQAEPPAPAGQTYVGARECAACHIEQFMTWRQTPHAQAFAKLPAKYQTDATCLKCHTTGHGTPTGFKSLAATPNLVGNSCEGCHGPGSKHVEVAKSFAQKQLTPQETAQVRDTIYLTLPKLVCIECHLAVGHKKHPPFDK
jgi:hypothetical protein